MDKVMGVQTLNVQVVFSFRNLIGRQNTNWIVANDVKNCYNPCLMAVERLEELLPELSRELPSDHPDQSYIARLKRFNELYGKSSERRRALVRYGRAEPFVERIGDEALEELFKITCSAFGIDEKQGRRLGRRKERTLATKAFCHMAYNYLSQGDITTIRLGDFLGYKEHSTVVYHLNTVTQYAEENIDFALKLLEIENQMRDRGLTE